MKTKATDNKTQEIRLKKLITKALTLKKKIDKTKEGSKLFLSLYQELDEVGIEIGAYFCQSVPRTTSLPKIYNCNLSKKDEENLMKLFSHKSFQNLNTVEKTVAIRDKMKKESGDEYCIYEIIDFIDRHPSITNHTLKKKLNMKVSTKKVKNIHMRIK